MNNYALIAKIVSVFNEQGYLKVIVSPGLKDVLLKQTIVFVDVFGLPRKFYVEDVFQRENFLAIKFKNFDSSEDVAFLNGKEILLPSEELQGAKKDFFLLSELKNVTVYRNGTFFGKVKDILNLEANDVLVLENKEGEEVLIPFVESIIKSVDIEGRRIDLIDGEGELFDVAD